MEDNQELSDQLQNAKTLIYNHNFNRAAEILEMVTNENPNNIEALNLLAYAIKMAKGNSEEAINESLQIMNRAIEIHPSNTLTIFNLASTYYELCDYNKAITYYNQLVNLNKINDYRVYFNLAMCFEKQGDNARATENYSQTLKLNPDFSSAVINYSNLLITMGKHTQAKYTLEHYLKNNKNDMRALNNLNIILAEKNIDSKVEDNFRKISQSGSITSVYNNAVFQSRSGKFTEALSSFKSLVERLQNKTDDPLLLLSHVNIGVLYEKTSNFDLAIQKYLQIIENFAGQINQEEFQLRISEVKAKERERNRISFIPKLANQTNHQPTLSKTLNNFNFQGPPPTKQNHNGVNQQKNQVSSIPRNNFLAQQKKSPEKKNEDYLLNKQQPLQPISTKQINKQHAVMRINSKELNNLSQHGDEYQLKDSQPTVSNKQQRIENDNFLSNKSSVRPFSGRALKRQFSSHREDSELHEHVNFEIKITRRQQPSDDSQSSGNMHKETNLEDKEKIEQLINNQKAQSKDQSIKNLKSMESQNSKKQKKLEPIQQGDSDLQTEGLQDDRKILDQLEKQIQKNTINELQETTNKQDEPKQIQTLKLNLDLTTNQQKPEKEQQNNKQIYQPFKQQEIISDNDEKYLNDEYDDQNQIIQLQQTEEHQPTQTKFLEQIQPIENEPKNLQDNQIILMQQIKSEQKIETQNETKSIPIKNQLEQSQIQTPKSAQDQSKNQLDQQLKKSQNQNNTSKQPQNSSSLIKSNQDIQRQVLVESQQNKSQDQSIVQNQSQSMIKPIEDIQPSNRILLDQVQNQQDQLNKSQDQSINQSQFLQSYAQTPISKSSQNKQPKQESSKQIFFGDQNQQQRTSDQNIKSESQVQLHEENMLINQQPSERTKSQQDNEEKLKTEPEQKQVEDKLKSLAQINQDDQEISQILAQQQTNEQLAPQFKTECDQQSNNENQQLEYQKEEQKIDLQEQKEQNENMNHQKLESENKINTDESPKLNKTNQSEKLISQQEFDIYSSKEQEIPQTEQDINANSIQNLRQSDQQYSNYKDLKSNTEDDTSILIKQSKLEQEDLKQKQLEQISNFEQSQLNKIEPQQHEQLEIQYEQNQNSKVDSIVEEDKSIDNKIDSSQVVEQQEEQNSNQEINENQDQTQNKEQSKIETENQQRENTINEAQVDEQVQVHNVEISRNQDKQEEIEVDNNQLLQQNQLANQVDKTLQDDIIENQDDKQNQSQIGVVDENNDSPVNETYDNQEEDQKEPQVEQRSPQQLNENLITEDHNNVEQNIIKKVQSEEDEQQKQNDEYQRQDEQQDQNQDNEFEEREQVEQLKPVDQDQIDKSMLKNESRKTMNLEDEKTETEIRSIRKKRKAKQQFQYPDDFDDWDIQKCLQLINEDGNNIFAHYKLAILYIEQSEIQVAKEYLIKVHQLNPDFEADKVSWGLGEVFESEKNWELALNQFKNVYPYTQDKQGCLLKIAKCYKKMQDFEHSVRTYQKAVYVNNKNFYPYYKLGWMQIKNADIKQGIDNLLKASCLDTQNLDILVKLGEGYLMFDEDETAVDEAIQTLERAVIIDPSNYNATITLAKAYEKKQDLEQAIEYAKKATQLQNGNINSYFYLGTLHMKKKELKQASEAFRTLLKNNTEHIDALIEYATIWSLQGNHDKAKKYFRHALKFDQNNITANLRLGKIYQTKLKDHTSAIECFNRILKSDQNNYKAHYYIGLSYMEKLDYKKATEFMKECLKINSRFNLGWKAIGNILYETNSPSKAVKYFQRALECDPTDLEAKIGLANCHYLMEDFDLAINLFEEISHIDHNEELEYNLANCYYMRNDYEEAIKHYQRALQMNPKKTECYYNLGNAYCIQERFQDALECFENSIKHDPNHSAALYNLANTYYVLNDYDNASQYFEQALILQPENVEWRNYVASLYLEKGDLNEAKRHIDQNMKIDPKNSDTYVKLATYQLQMKNTKEALNNVRIALSINPDNDEAQLLLNDIEK